MLKIRVRDSHAYGEKEAIAYRSEAPDEQGEYALQLIEKFGLISAMPEGEDTAGRQTMRLLTPAEVVARAFTIADMAFAALRAQGRMVSLPDLNEINAENDSKRAKKRETETV